MSMTYNDNMGMPLVPDDFFKTLEHLPEGTDILEIRFADRHVTVKRPEDIATRPVDKDTYLIFDRTTGTVISGSDWEKYGHALDHLEESKKETALDRFGLYGSYCRAVDWLREHRYIHTIRVMRHPKNEPGYRYDLIRFDLSYGFRIAGMLNLPEGHIWEIETHERAIKENDRIRPYDSAYLLCDKEGIYESARAVEMILMAGRDFNSLDPDIRCDRATYGRLKITDDLDGESPSVWGEGGLDGFPKARAASIPDSSL